MLKPYYIKVDETYIRIILAYQYFSVVVNNKDYQFIPVEANQIKIDRNTKEVLNTDDVFVFQNGKEIVHVPMSKLISLPDFLEQLHAIAESYYIQDDQEEQDDQISETRRLINELEKQNIKRLIDAALDARDEKMFHELSQLL